MRRINEIEETLRAKSDEDLRNMTAMWKAELSKMESPQDQWKRLDEILPEAFAVVKNAARRLTERQQTFTVCDQPMTWNMVHFDVQLIGGMVPAPRQDRGNGHRRRQDARRDPAALSQCAHRPRRAPRHGERLPRPPRRRMDGAALRFPRPDRRLHSARSAARCSPRSSTRCDITYGTNTEFGFDYLRDNGMATTREQQVQRGYHFAIVDEVDSILIDEARTPLIISGPATVSTHQYDKFKPLVDQLVRKQTMLCNRLASEAEGAFRTPARSRKAVALMFKVKLGQPRNKPLLRMMEDPEKRRAIDKAELSFYQDTRKEELFALKEELFFTIDEKAHEADLSEQGREFMNPDDPDAFVLPDLISEFTEIDLDPTLSQARKGQAESRAPGSIATRKASASTTSRSSCAPTAFREGRAVRRRGKQGRHRR